MEGRNPTEWPMLREGQAKLKRLAAKGDKEAKRELEYRKILRADSTTSKARGKSTKGKNLSDWQAFQHEMRGKGMTSAQMSAAYRKKMAEPKRKTKSKAKATSKAKAAAPKNGRKVGWIAFWKRAAAAGYTMKQTQPLWKKYKAGKGAEARRCTSPRAPQDCGHEEEGRSREGSAEAQDECAFAGQGPQGLGEEDEQGAHPLPGVA
jgi:hypothetical protein